MDVGAVGPAMGRLFAQDTEPEDEVGEVEEVEEEGAAEPAETEQAEEAEEADGDEGGQPGVIRLLLAGHFRGVADVVLRINFHDELAAIEADAQQEAAVEAAGALTEAVQAKVAEVTGSGLLDEEQVAAVEELHAEFDATVEGLTAEMSEAEAPDLNAFIGAVRDAFDAFMAGLRELTAEPEPEPTDGAAAEGELPAAEEPAPEGTEPTDLLEGDEEPVAPTLEDLLAEMEDLFAIALEDLEAAAQSASVLPPLSPPTGGGVAYWKFLAIYNELRGMSSADALPGQEADGEQAEGTSDQPLDVAA